MRATRSSRASRSNRAVRRTKRRAKPAAKRQAKRVVKSKAVPAKPAVVRKSAIVPLEPVLYKLCKAGWAVVVDRTPNALGTRFVCPFCPKSHRVPGPVRGFKKLRHAQWGRLRRVEE